MPPNLPGMLSGTASRPQRPASLRICRPHGDEPEREAERWLRAYHAWPARVVERRATVDVLRLVPRLE
jgi:hypothetical protein